MFNNLTSYTKGKGKGKADLKLLLHPISGYASLSVDSGVVCVSGLNTIVTILFRGAYLRLLVHCAVTCWKETI